MLRYRDLTQEDKLKICNGCGAKGGWFNPPEFLFHASCNQHDFYYWRGGTSHDRGLADKAFYKFMRKDANNGGILLPVHHVLALTYFLAVRFFGKKAFNEGTMKTREDLDKLHAGD